MERSDVISLILGFLGCLIMTVWGISNNITFPIEYKSLVRNVLTGVNITIVLMLIMLPKIFKPKNNIFNMYSVKCKYCGVEKIKEKMMEHKGKFYCKTGCYTKHLLDKLEKEYKIESGVGK